MTERKVGDETPQKKIKTPGSGRKKGSRNKNSSSLRQALDQAGFNLAEEFLKLLEAQTDPEKRRSDIIFLFKYVYPVLKEQETAPEPVQSPQVNPASALSNEQINNILSIKK